jgi:hypothetical protein
MEESAQKSVTPHVHLARDYFPTVCRQKKLGALSPWNWKNLAKQFKDWDQPPEVIRTMIDKFGEHPDWCRGKTPWKVFLAHREQLLLLATKHGQQWWERPRPTVFTEETIQQRAAMYLGREND